MKTPNYQALYKAVEWLDCYEPAPGEDGSEIEEVKAWLIELGNKGNEKQFRAEVRKEAIEQYARENGVTKRQVREALKRIKKRDS